MSKSMPSSLPPPPVQRLADRGDTPVQKVDLSEIPLETAKAQIGSAVHRSITRTDSVLKDYGDPSHVKRVCDGDVPNVIARAWQRADRRRELLLALLEASGLTVRVKTVIEMDPVG